jgi:hypothetical protein
MNGNFQRTPIGESIQRIAREGVGTQLQREAKALPCSVVSVNGQFVTVKFEVNSGIFTLPNITIPINTSEYDWIPVQVGDLGYTQAADVALAAVSGVSSNVPNLVQGMNLTSLVFQPISNMAWTVANSNQRIVQGPSGAVIQVTGGATSLTVTSSGIFLKTTRLNVATLPTSPGAAGDIYNHSGTLMVS